MFCSDENPPKRPKILDFGENEIFGITEIRSKIKIAVPPKTAESEIHEKLKISSSRNFSGKMNGKLECSRGTGKTRAKEKIKKITKKSRI